LARELHELGGGVKRGRVSPVDDLQYKYSNWTTSSINNTTTGRISNLNIPTELDDLQYKDSTVKSQECILGYFKLAMKPRSG
jgi:hypothetical protein